MLIVVVAGLGDSTTATAPGAWQQAQESSGGQNRRTAIFYYANNPGSVSSVVITFGASTTAIAGQMVEWSGMNTLAPLDVFGRNNSTSTTTLTVNGNQSNNNQDAYANEIAVTAFQEDLTSAGTVTFTPGAGWTNFGTTSATSTTMQYTADYETGLANNATPQETETSSVSSSAVGWGGVLATFAPLPTCTGGSLTLGTQSVTFNVTLNGKDKTANTQPQFTPSDLTGSGAGWNIQLTSTTFTVSGHTLSTTATVLTSTSDTTDGGSCVAPTNSVTYPITVPAAASAPTAVKVYNAAANTGKGDSSVQFNFTLSTLASAFAGHYLSTWTVTIASGP